MTNEQTTNADDVGLNDGLGGVSGGNMERIVFEDDRIWAVQAGAELTHEERTFLLEDTPRFEECFYTRQELEAMNDAELISAAYATWADYCR